MGAIPVWTPAALAAALSAMLVNCKALYLVDPHFGPENARHRKVLEAFMEVLSTHGLVPAVVRVHCSVKSELAFFEREATKMAARLPSGISIEFARWTQRDGGERLHNRYVLTDLGGVALGIGLDAGDAERPTIFFCCRVRSTSAAGRSTSPMMGPSSGSTRLLRSQGLARLAFAREPLMPEAAMNLLYMRALMKA